MNENGKANALSAAGNAPAKPEAYLKFWWIEGETPKCRVDLTDICEPWLDALKPTIVPLYRKVEPSPANLEDMEDDLEQVICDAPVRLEQPSTHKLGGIPALLHRLNVMARVAGENGRGGDAVAAREAARVIGELQSHVTRLNPDGDILATVSDKGSGVVIRGEPHPVEEFDPLPLDGQ
jgi:hypothetical protein